MGCRFSAEMNGIAGDPVYLAVKAIFCIAVREHEIFCTGGYSKTQPVTGLKGVGSFVVRMRTS